MGHKNVKVTALKHNCEQLRVLSCAATSRDQTSPHQAWDLSRDLSSLKVAKSAHYFQTLTYIQTSCLKTIKNTFSSENIFSIVSFLQRLNLLSILICFQWGPETLSLKRFSPSQLNPFFILRLVSSNVHFFVVVFKNFVFHHFSKQFS